MFPPSALPAGATHRDDDRIRDVDAVKAARCLMSNHHATWVLTGHLVPV